MEKSLFEFLRKNARKVVALIEKCYQNRTLLEMPWLGDLEMRRARELAHG